MLRPAKLMEKEVNRLGSLPINSVPNTPNMTKKIGPFEETYSLRKSEAPIEKSEFKAPEPLKNTSIAAERLNEVRKRRKSLCATEEDIRSVVKVERQRRKEDQSAMKIQLGAGERVVTLKKESSVMSATPLSKEARKDAVIAKLSAQIKELQTKMAGKDATSSSMKRELESIKARHNVLAQENKEMGKELEMTQRKLSAAENKASKAEAARKDLDRRLNELNARCLKLQSELADRCSSDLLDTVSADDQAKENLSLQERLKVIKHARFSPTLS